MSAEEVIDDALAAIEKVRAAVPMVSDFLGPKGTFASRLISWSLGALFEGLSEIRTTRTTETFEEVRARYAAKVTFEATELLRARIEAMPPDEMTPPVDRTTDPETPETPETGEGQTS